MNRANAASSPTVLLCIPCLQIGGTELQTLALANALISDGWQARVLVYYDEIENAMRCEFERCGAAVTGLGLRRSVSLPGLLFRLVRVFRDMPTDVIHVQYMAPGFTPVLAARLAGSRRVVATVHQSASAHGRKARRLLRAASSMCDAFICNSLATEKSWFVSSRVYDPVADSRPRGHYTVYNAVDVVGISHTVHRTDRSGLAGSLGLDRTPIIGVVGRLREEKGQETAVRALPALLRSHPSAGLLIVGDGPDRENLRQLCRILGVDSAVRFAGGLPSAQVHPLYALMDVLAVPSRHEGFGLVAAEAMAAGVPVVASDVPALAEVLAGGEAGILTPPGDGEALAAGLSRVLSDSDLRARIRQAASVRVERLFSRRVFDRNAAAIHRSMLSQ